jgi:lipopolysaccharide export system permease protein
MLLIDRYLLRQFAWVLVVCFCSLSGLYIVADALGNLEEFLSHAAKTGDLAGTLAAYYGYRTISFFDRTSGVLTLIAAMFTLAWLQRHNEMTALLAAGISKRRIIAPIVIAVACVSILAALNRELLTPRFRDKFSRNAQDLADDAARRLEPRYDNLTGVLIRGKQLLTNQQTIQEPNFMLPRELDDYGRHLGAAAAVYQPATTERPAGFLFQNVTQPRDITSKPSLKLPSGEPAVITPRDAPWLEPNECFVISAVEFDQLLDAASWRQYSSTWDLIQGLYNRSLDFGSEVRVTIHSRLVQPVLDVALLFLGIPLVLRQSNRNVFVAIGLCIGVVILFLLVVTGCHYLGSSILISPVLAVWLPLFVFIPLAVWMAEPIVE